MKPQPHSDHPYKSGRQERPGAKALPGHIAALLQRQQRDGAGRPADSAGIAWAGRDLSGEGNPLHTFDGDDGLAAPALEKARQKLLSGELEEPEFVNSLRGLRLFVPVLATVAEEGQPVHTDAGQAGPVGDKQADIALVSITANDGRRALPVFSSVETLTQWHPDARPVAAETERAALAALGEDADLLVLDPGAELTFVIRRPAVYALAQDKDWVPSYRSQDLAAALGTVVEECPGVVRLVMQPSKGIATATASGRNVPGGGSGPELTIGVEAEPGLDDVGTRLAVASVQASLAGLDLLAELADSVEVVLART